MDSERFHIHADHEETHWWFTARRRIVRRLLHRVLPPDPESLVVEVGCGTGGNTAALASDYRMIGIDPAAAAIDLARDRFPQTEFINGFAPGDLGDRLSEARAVLLLDVLEHVPDDFELLSNLLAVTRPGTKFVITVPADERLWSSHDVAFEHYRRYDLDRLRAIWAGLPVAEELVSSLNTRLYPIVRFVRALSRFESRRRSGEAAHGEAGTDFTAPIWPINRTLHALFAGESRRLLRELDRGQARRRRGVSLVAVLERLDGTLVPRTKPAEIPPDRHTPLRHAT